LVIIHIEEVHFQIMNQLILDMEVLLICLHHLDESLVLNRFVVQTLSFLVQQEVNSRHSLVVKLFSL
jgi:hypothetical protein